MAQLQKYLSLCGDEAFPLASNMMRPYPSRLISEDKQIFTFNSQEQEEWLKMLLGLPPHNLGYGELKSWAVQKC